MAVPPGPPATRSGERRDPIRVLVVEDVADDAELELQELKGAGLDLVSSRVETREAFTEALESFRPDIILSDYHMPRFDGLTALRLARAIAPAVPVIVVTGSLNEEIAVECMREGAADYILKDRLSRLAFAVQSALEMAAIREVNERAEQQLRLRGSALEAAANAIVIADSEGLIEWVNPAFTAMTGYSPEEVYGQSSRILKSGNQGQAFYRHLWETISSGNVWNGELYNRRKDGSLYIEEMTITPVRGKDGTITHFVAVKQDISARKRQEQEVRALSSSDPLTRLPNRAALQEALAVAVESATRERPGALVLMDVDNFQLVNDSAGHGAGDHVLVVIGELLSGTLREGDYLARLGGDEFGALLRDVSLEDARLVAESLRARVDDFRFHLGEHDFDLGISLGVCPVDGSKSSQAVLALADAAVFAAKELGKNRVVVFRNEAERGDRIAQASHWVTRVKNALREGLFVLHFQPVVHLASETADHHEVLVRMRGPDGSLVPPGAFIPSAERFGLMPQVDCWVVEHALSHLRADPRSRLFVNVSGSSLGDEGLLSWIERSVADSALDPGRLTFEITETATVADLPWVQTWIRRLKELGCLFALDDFGVGFSSFAYLRALPVDFVKIDGSFIRDLDRDPTNVAIVKGMVSVAHALGKGVIAEFVERRRIAALLAEIGAEYGQGFLWGRPGPVPLPPLPEAPGDGLLPVT